MVMLAAIFTVHLRYGFSSINTIGLNAARSGREVLAGAINLHSATRR
jgi:hypothetical protein